MRDAEAIGLGSAFISERWKVKEACALSGAVGAVSTRLGIATAATNQNTRHPIITASFAMTMHRLTDGRFTLGLGRGIGPLFDVFGMPRLSTDAMEDFAGLMRRLWRGEFVVGHDGPAGRFPFLHLDMELHEEIPLLLTAFVPASLRLGGRAFDAVVLHTFFSDETLARCVRDGEARGGGGRPRSGVGARLVVLRHRRRPHRSGAASQEDGRSPRHLSAGLRRPDGEDQPLGPGGAGAAAQRRRLHELPRRDRREGDHRAARAPRRR